MSRVGWKDYLVDRRKAQSSRAYGEDSKDL